MTACHRLEHNGITTESLRRTMKLEVQIQTQCVSETETQRACQNQTKLIG
jgi:hypothetical protein